MKKTLASSIVTLTATALITAVLAVPAYCVPASPDSFSVKQPDGTLFNAMKKGDEWNNWTETTSGYTVVQDPKTKVWEYAIIGPCGDLISSGVAVKPDVKPPADIPMHVKPDTGGAGGGQENTGKSSGKQCKPQKKPGPGDKPENKPYGKPQF